MASIPTPTTAGAQAASSGTMLGQPSFPASMLHPLLLAAACKGDLKELSYLLDREAQPDMMPPQHFLDLLATYGTSGFHGAAADLEQGTSVQAPSPATLLEGVTVEGDTALHVVAANGDGEIFLRCADLIHFMDRTFLSRQNTNGDTPLHCAARAGHAQMVSHLVALATSDTSMLEDLLRMENCRKETVLHEAVRVGDNQLVKDLLKVDPELACFPTEGSSPLYLALLLKEDTIAEALHEESKDKVLSYLGPNGQNALHAAVLRGPVLTRRLLEWNKYLATKADENGSTPLHFAAGRESGAQQGREIVQLLLEANTAALYQPDQQGLFPIHVAANAGETKIIALFVERCRSSSRLRDSKGGTFLHVAVHSANLSVVNYACQIASLACILNMQDNDGNTALHLAVKAMHLGMVSVLVGRPEVNMNLTNAQGQTPLDIAEYMIPPWRSCGGRTDSVNDIHYLLQSAGATSGVSCRDHFKENYCENFQGVKADREIERSKLLKESSQSMLVGSVQVATVTFGAAFAMPGGYRQDDHAHGGTPTLAWSPSSSIRHAFNGFVIADAIAILGSWVATAGFLYSGDPTNDLGRRETYFSISKCLMHVSIITMAVAFGLGMLAMLRDGQLGKSGLGLAIGGIGVVYILHYTWDWITFVQPIWIRRNGHTFRFMKVAGSFLIILALWTLAEGQGQSVLQSWKDLWTLVEEQGQSVLQSWNH